MEPGSTPVFLGVRSGFSPARGATAHHSVQILSETAIPRLISSLSREMMDWLLAFLAELSRFGEGRGTVGQRRAGGAGDGFIMLLSLHPSDGWAGLAVHWGKGRSDIVIYRIPEEDMIHSGIESSRIKKSMYYFSHSRASPFTVFGPVMF